MHVSPFGMDLPHLFVDRTCENVGGVLHRETEPGEVGKFGAIGLGVKRPFMLTPPPICHDDSLVYRRRRYSVDVCSKNNMALGASSWPVPNMCREVVDETCYDARQSDVA